MQDKLAKWVVEELYTKIQIMRPMTFKAIEGGAYSYTRTAALSPALPLGDGTSGITDQTPALTASNAQFVMGELATRFKLDYSARDRWLAPFNPDEALSANALRSLSYGFCRKLDVPNTSANGDFDSLRDLCVNLFPSANGTPLQRLDELQAALSLVTANNGKATAIMCHSRALRWIIGAYMGAGLKPDLVDTEWTDPTRGIVPSKLVGINGVPIYLNDFIAIEPQGGPDEATRIYFMVIGDSDESGPTRGVTGIIPAPLDGTMFVRRESSEPASGTTSIINVDYTWPVGLAMGSPGALSMLANVDVTDYPTLPNQT